MKQHLTGSQLKEIDYEDRITLISFATGLTKDYVREEYKKGVRHEEAMLLNYGYELKIGDLIELIEDYTGQFPAPSINGGRYQITIAFGKNNGDLEKIESNPEATYCDALYDIVKVLLEKKYITLE